MTKSDKPRQYCPLTDDGKPECMRSALQKERDELKAEVERLENELDKYELIAGNTYQYYDKDDERFK